MLKHKGTPVLRTKRLQLRRFCVQDAQQMTQNYVTDARVTRFLSWTPHPDIGCTRSLLEQWEQCYGREDYYNWAIEMDGRLIGSIGVVSLDERNRNCEVGYCISYSDWGKGIVAEALEEVLRFLFCGVGMHRVTAKHDAENPNSGRVMQKCGMQREGRMKEFYRRHDGTYGDCVLYGITAADWAVNRGVELPPEAEGEADGAPTWAAGSLPKILR
jgi:ribosomal-protein-alanine N-acetyltransferase